MDLRNTAGNEKVRDKEVQKGRGGGVRGGGGGREGDTEGGGGPVRVEEIRGRKMQHKSAFPFDAVALEDGSVQDEN